MSRYGQLTTRDSEPCRETKKHVKHRLKLLKLKMKDFLEITNHIDMNWEHRKLVIGELYLDMQRAKEELKRMKLLKVKK